MVPPAQRYVPPATATAKVSTGGRRSVITHAGVGASQKSSFFSLGRRVNRKALAVFTRQLAMLIKAGMPLLRSLEVLGRQEKNPAFKAIMESLAHTIRSGGNFSDGLMAHDKIFDRLYINMVKAGEASGALDTVLARLAGFMEKAEHIKGKVRTAMVYPIIIVLVAAVIVSTLMIFVVPKFQEIFAGLLKGQPLPPLTLGLLTVSNFIKVHFLVTL